MPSHGIESKGDFLKVGDGLRGLSSRTALTLFIVAGTIVTICIFLVLQSFIQSIVRDERLRMSEDFVHDVVSEIQGLQAPFFMLSNVLSGVDPASASAMADAMRQSGSGLDVYSQMFWFYRNTSGQWTYKTLSKGSEGGVRLVPDGKLLGKILGVAGDQVGIFRVIGDIKAFDVVEHRSWPKLASGKFALVRSVGATEVTGILLAVVEPAELFDEDWIREHRDLAYIRLRTVEDNRPLFLLQREKDLDVAAASGQIYEFPFAGQNWEISSVLHTDSRSDFLEIFPYVIMVLGFMLTGAGAFYVHSVFRQSASFALLNGELEQKNQALKSEVTERERLNHALRDAQAENKAVIDSISDIIFEIDREGVLVYLNRAWEKMTGFEIEQSLGQEFFLMLHPHDQAVQKQEFKNLLKGNKRELRSYTQVRVSDGTFVAVEMSVSIVQQDQRKGMRVVGTLTNIEERRRAERALSEAEKKYRNIVENAAGGIYQLTPEGLFLSANPALARILGYDSPENLLREIKNANEYCYADAAARAQFFQLFAGQDSVTNFETQMKRRDGSLIWVNENARAVKDENGQILFIEGSIEDITQRKLSDVAIREAKKASDLANRAKSDFISNMSHELRTPLNSIIGFSDMIKSEVLGAIGQPAYKEYAADIYQSGQRLLRVINEILDISKIEAGERQLNEGIVKVGAVVDSVLAMLSEKIQASRMIITKSLDGAPEIVAEELAMKQAIMNLLSNAVKFTPDGGRITIAAYVDKQGRFVLSIADTGIGLDEMEIKKALSPFGQVDNDLSRAGSGTGLGLTLVDALAKMHGGEFELFSQKGIGTTASLILPPERVIKKKEKVPAPAEA